MIRYTDDRLAEPCELQEPTPQGESALLKILGIAFVIALIILLSVWPPVSLGASMSVTGARKEAAKRWPDGRWVLKVDQSKSKHVYELEVVVDVEQFALVGKLCSPMTRTFKGSSWQSVFDQSKDVRSTCVKK